MANPLIVHRIKTMLLGIVDVHDNILASSIQVTYKSTSANITSSMLTTLHDSVGEVSAGGNEKRKNK